MRVPYRPPVIDTDPTRLMSVRQCAYIRYLCNEHRLRVYSVVRQVTGKDLPQLSYHEAHLVIQYLESYDDRYDEPYHVQVRHDVGRALAATNQRSSLLGMNDYALALLGTNRVATPGQIWRYLLGVGNCNYDIFQKEVEPLLKNLTDLMLIARMRSVPIPVFREGAVTDVFYLTEAGSDLLHDRASRINCYAKTALLSTKLIEHELAVTEARLDMQSDRHFLTYEPEPAIKGEQERARRKRRQNQSGEEEIGHSDEQGCGDFRANVEDIHTGRVTKIEVEVSVNQSCKKLMKKPRHITDHYVATKRQQDIVEHQFGVFAKLIPDVRRPMCGGDK